MPENKPIVANIHSTFFEKSETFIYNYLTNLKNFKPICFALDYINLDQFPFPREDLYYFNKRLLNRPKYIDVKGVKLIHAHFGHIGFNSLKLKRKSGLPLVTTFYGSDVSKMARKKRWKKNYKILFSEGDLFLAEGNNMRSGLIELGCPEDKIQIQRIAVPLKKNFF